NKSTPPPDVFQTGFSRTTTFIATTGGGVNSYIPGLPGTGTLQNPFPGGILQPQGTSLGYLTDAGSSLTYEDPNREIPRVHQINAGFGYELPSKVMLEAAYVGTRTHDSGVNKQLDAITLAERLQGVANPNYLNAA